MTQEENPERERWHGQVAFVFAAIGSAVGLGNFWRFPAIAAANGGGQFFVPYLLSLIIIGIPLLLLELTVGQRFQSNCFDSFAAVSKHFKGVGIAAVLTSSLIVVYYMAVIAWTLVYFVDSFRANADGNLIWTGNEAPYFFGTVLDISSGPAEQGGLVAGPTVGLLVGWIITAFCIFQGPKTMSWVVYVTMPLPIICLIVLLGRSSTLPGADEGIDFYLHGSASNPRPLDNARIWVDALGQIFFSLSLGFGIMPAYGSYVPRTVSVFRNAIIIAVSNSIVSFLAGFVVFGTLGHMAHVQSVTMEALLSSSSGVGLAFIAFPAALSTLPDAQQFFAVVFFIMLFSLGLDSAFSLVEAIAAIFKDHLPATVPKVYVAPAVCLLFFLLGLPFTSRGGLYYLDILDHYMNRSLLLVACFEVIAFAWFYSPKNLPHLAFRERVEELAEVSRRMLGISQVWIAYTFVMMLKFVVFPLLVVMIAMTIYDESLANYGNYRTDWLFLGGAFYLFALLIVVVMAFVPYEPRVDSSDDSDHSGGKAVAVRT